MNAFWGVKNAGITQWGTVAGSRGHNLGHSGHSNFPGCNPHHQCRVALGDSLGQAVLGTKNYEKGAVVELQVTDRYYRAIAKIGFHYFLTQFPAFDGSAP